MLPHGRLRRAPLVIFVLVSLASAGEAGLAPGGTLPSLETRTLNGDPASLPGDAAGRDALLVFGFSKAAAKISKGWLDACRAAAAGPAAGNPGPARTETECYDVRMVEEVPHAFRGMMERGMRSGFPIEWQRRTLLVSSGNAAWRERLGVTDAGTAYIVGLDAAGRVRGLAHGSYAEPELKRVLGWSE